MYLPISYEGVIEDYNKVLNGVQLWDVGVERQIQIKGPDAEALAQFLTPRNIKKCAVGQAMYAPFLDFNGGFLGLVLDGGVVDGAVSGDLPLLKL